MWFRQSKTTVTNLETGLGFAVRGVADARQVTTWEVASTNPNRNPGTLVLEVGYKTQDEALAALDEFLSAQGVKATAIQPPVTEEELEQETKSDNE
jgi:hypothetical protein